MTLSGNQLVPWKKGVFTWGGIAFDNTADQKLFLMGNDGDVGPTFDGDLRITGAAIQAEITTLDAGETMEVNVYKGTEGAGAVYSASVSTASATTVSGSDYTPSSEDNAVLAANTDDLIITLTGSANVAIAKDLCVQVFYEWVGTGPAS